MHYHINGAISENNLLKINCVFCLLLEIRLNHFSFEEEFGEISQMYGRLHVEYPYSCQVLMKLEFSRQSFKLSSNIKFHENPSFANRVVPRRQTDIKRLIIYFRNFAKVPKNSER
jgi:hypothetical protein